MGTALAFAILAMCVSVAMAVATGLVLKKHREDAHGCERAVEGVRGEWEAFSSKSEQASKRLAERLDRIETDAGERMNRLDQAASDLGRRLALFHDNAVDTRECLNRVSDLLAETQGQLERFEQYTKDFLQRELSQSFARFDQTVGAVLGEMKNELLRGVERIDQIQSVVETRSDAEKRLFGGDAGFKMLGEATEAPLGSETVPEPHGDLAFEEPEEEDEGDEEDIFEPAFMESTDVCETSSESVGGEGMEMESPPEPDEEYLGVEADAPLQTPPEPAPSAGIAFEGDEDETVDLRPSEDEEPIEDTPGPAPEAEGGEAGSEEAGNGGGESGEETRPFEPAPAEAEGSDRSDAATPAGPAGAARVRLPGPLGAARPPRSPLARSGPAALKRLLQRR